MTRSPGELRDEAALRAMQALIQVTEGKTLREHDVALCAFAFADAFMKARGEVDVHDQTHCVVCAKPTKNALCEDCYMADRNSRLGDADKPHRHVPRPQPEGHYDIEHTKDGFIATPLHHTTELPLSAQLLDDKERIVMGAAANLTAYEVSQLIRQSRIAIALKEQLATKDAQIARMDEVIKSARAFHASRTVGPWGGDDMLTAANDLHTEILFYDEQRIT